MKTASRIVTPVIRNLLRSFCRVDKEGLKKIPFRGPFIIVINHINFLEVPLIYSYLFPREIIGLVKTEPCVL